MSPKTLPLRLIRPLTKPHISVPKSLSSQLKSNRNFHSHDHPSPPSPFNAVETSILSSAITHIPSYGFTNTSLSLGARDAGYIDASTNLFPRGAVSVVHFWLWKQRMGLKERVEEMKEEGTWQNEKDVQSRVECLAWERLMGNREIVARWQEALALLSTPSSLPLAVSELALLSDEILYLSGSTAVDSTWYSKRLGLSSIYASSELHMTTDKSPNFADTKDFMMRRFSDAKVVGDAVGSVGQWVGFTASAAVNVLRSKGVRI